jgi:diguanylate cyclase (GGDEF)-like protein
VRKISYYNRIERLGWIVVTVVDRKEITNPILLKMFINILVVGLIAVFLGWYLSVALGRQLIVPLEELHKRVSLIVSGETESASSRHYPDNEIGAIAMNIEQLTEHELFKRNRELQRVNSKLERLSTTDQLTGLYNRRKIQNELEKEWDRSKRYNTVFSIIMYDIDWFKKINDTYGHQAGDEVLRSIADLTRSNFRSTDIISRWGGEEFMILCPETFAGDACRMAWKFCSSVKSHDFPGGISVSISAGVCNFSPENNLDFIIRTADERLYQAKQSGRDRVVPASCENPAADKSGST